MLKGGSSQTASACLEVGIRTGDANAAQNCPIYGNQVLKSWSRVTCHDAASWPVQVLNIVYGGSAAKPSAFYPKGVNGNINGTGSA